MLFSTVLVWSTTAQITDRHVCYLLLKNGGLKLIVGKKGKDNSYKPGVLFVGHRQTVQTHTKGGGSSVVMLTYTYFYNVSYQSIWCGYLQEVRRVPRL